MTDDPKPQDEAPAAPSRVQGCIVTALQALGVAFLAFGILQWALGVHIGLEYLETGQRHVDRGQLEFDAFYDASWIWLSLIALGAWFFCRKNPKSAILANVVIYLLLTLSFVTRVIIAYIRYPG